MEISHIPCKICLRVPWREQAGWLFPVLILQEVHVLPQREV